MGSGDQSEKIVGVAAPSESLNKTVVVRGNTYEFRPRSVHDYMRQRAYAIRLLTSAGHDYESALMMLMYRSIETRCAELAICVVSAPNHWYREINGVKIIAPEFLAYDEGDQIDELMEVSEELFRFLQGFRSGDRKPQ